MGIVSELQSKILTRSTTPGEYQVTGFPKTGKLQLHVLQKPVTYSSRFSICQLAGKMLLHNPHGGAHIAL
jgi:hypothetical protein